MKDSLLDSNGYSSLISQLMNHRSIRKYKDQEVTDEQLEVIIAAGQMASTSSNVQAYSVIAVTDSERKRELSLLCGDQSYVRECPIFLVWCADLYRLKEASSSYIGENDSYEDSTENFIVATVDAALAAQNAAVAAESLGLGIVYIGGIRNQIEQVSSLLGLPELVYPVFGMCVGYPDQEPSRRPRLPLQGVLHREHYQQEETVKQVERYDEVMTAYLKERTGGTKDTPWSQLMAERLKQPARLHMQDFLKKKGFLRR